MRDPQELLVIHRHLHREPKYSSNTPYELVEGAALHFDPDHSRRREVH
jgi:hypothetical protein